MNVLEVETEHDTVRRDWLIFIIGLLAAGWFFFDYDNHHPLARADASLGKQAIITQGSELLNLLGYSLAESDVVAGFQVNTSLLDSLQRQVDVNDFLADPFNRSIYQTFTWNLDIHVPGLDESQTPGSPGGGGPPQDRPEYILRFDENGRLLEFRNPGQRRPARLLNPAAMRETTYFPRSLMPFTRTDSLTLEIFSFDFTEGEEIIGGLTEDDRVVLTKTEAAELADFYLRGTGWPSDLEPESIELVTFDSFDAAELIYRAQADEVTQALELTVRLSPGGSLLSMTANYSSLNGPTPPVELFLQGLRGFLMVIFFFWVIILLYIRIRLNVVDIKSAVLFAVLAGIFFPLFEVLRWVYDTIEGPVSPNVIDFLMFMLQTGLVAAIASLGFFIVTVTSESITRQNWSKKIGTLDLLRMGHLFNKAIGKICIHAVSFGFILAAGWSLLKWFFPDSYIQPGTTFQSDQVYLSPLVHLVSLALISFLTVQAIYLLLIGQLRNYTRNKWITILVSTVVFFIMVPIYFETGPTWIEMVFCGIIGLFLGIIYVNLDFLTTFLTFFVFSMLITTADGWIMENSPDAIVFYPAAGLLVILLVFGFIAISRGKSVRELPNYIPDYIEELAQEERIKQELEIARKVQQSFLPVHNPDVYGLDLGSACIPAYETGGDYYDFIWIDQRRVAVTIGDVSGKGFQAAFYMTFIKGVLHALCKDFTTTETILEKANELFYENANRGTFISLIFGVIDLETGVFIFSRAGHNPLLHYRKSEKKLDIIRPNGFALGMTRGEIFSDHISEQVIQLEKDDLLILFTDGIVEANDIHNEFYGDQRLHKLIRNNHDKTADEIVTMIIGDVHDFSKGSKQHDDMTLVVIRKK